MAGGVNCGTRTGQIINVEDKTMLIKSSSSVDCFLSNLLCKGSVEGVEFSEGGGVPGFGSDCLPHGRYAYIYFL